MKTEKLIDDYLNSYQRYEEYWNYEDGCVLLGAAQMYEATKNESYVKFIEDYLKYFITEDGRLEHAHPSEYNLDSINSGKVLFFMYDQTGEEKYRRVIETMMNQLRQQPRCKNGSFWYKETNPAQVWLDGVYMAQPFYMEYETRYDRKEKYNDIISQFENVQKYMYDEKKGLCCHAYDEDKVQPWADKQTGCSDSFLLGSMGWYLMALVDVMDKMSIEIYEHYRKLQDIYQMLLRGILRYRMIENGRSDGNAAELLGSLMVAYSILKACRMGILLKEKYAPVGIRILKQVMGEQAGEYEPEEAGVFMMAYAQYLQLKAEMELD